MLNERSAAKIHSNRETERETGDGPQFVTDAEHYWRAMLMDLIEVELRLGNRGLSSVTFSVPSALK